MGSRLALVLVSSVALAGAPGRGGAPAADFCRQDDLAAPGAAASAYSRRSGYCDGAVFQRNAGDSELPVIGVAAGPVAGNPRLHPVRLTTIAVPGSASGLVWPLHLQGVARAIEVNYRLDAALSSAQSLLVGPESAMLAVSPRLRAEEVAWSAWSDSSQAGRTYIPVIVPGQAAGPVEITVRPTIPVAYVLFSVEDPATHELLLPKANAKPTGGPEQRAAPITFTIPRGRPEIVVVKVTAVGNSGETQVAGVRLLRPGA